MNDNNTPRARKGDPGTSHEAAALAALGVRKVQAAVLKFAAQCEPEGFTDVEMNDFFDDRGSSHRTRRSELVAKGLIEDSGKRKGEQGRRHIVWRLTNAGHAKLWEVLALKLAA